MYNKPATGALAVSIYDIEVRGLTNNKKLVVKNYTCCYIDEREVSIMKKHRILFFILSLVTIMSLCTTAFAADLAPIARVDLEKYIETATPAQAKVLSVSQLQHSITTS